MIFSFDFSQPSILRNMFLAFMGFGFFMGITFPFFADLFVVWKEGMLIWFVLSCIVAGISIGFINFWLLNKMLLRRLQRIGEVANAISNNDISQKCTLQSNDFIGEMAYSFNLMGQNLREMVKRIADVADELNKASEQLNEVTAKTQHSVEQQQQDTVLVASAMKSMNAAVEAMSQEASAALSAADAANSATDKGGQVVNETVQTISRLAEEVEQAAQVIKRLEADSETIGSVLDVIKDIAEQTNLLALNAAIEAARAGEHGRGFAVVADEVRILASRTQDSTKQIEKTIERLQSAAQQAVGVMNRGREQAHLSVNKANAAGDSLTAIKSAVVTIDQTHSHMTKVSQQQRQQAENVNRNIAHISEVAHHVADGASHTNQAGHHVGTLSKQLCKLIRQFKTQ